MKGKVAHACSQCNALQHDTTHCNNIPSVSLDTWKAKLLTRFPSFSNGSWQSTGVLQCVAVCCSMVQCVAVCCGELQCVADTRSMLQCVAVSCGELQLVAVCCGELQCVAYTHNTKTCRGTVGIQLLRCNVSQYIAIVALCCIVLRCAAVQCVAVYYCVLQCVAAT